MTRGIRRLDAVTIGQIAAGEVIERPVSVVKELVENALDAGAERITVALRGGGLREIEVIDDGSGISADDLPLAVERHATSKLEGPQSLEALTTLGFRGEGLASIASVARVTLSSRRRQDEFASRVEAFEEQVGPVEITPGPIGTRVSARDLFANVPVRREYLRSAQAETTRVSGFLTTLALGYPDVSFRLRVDDREVVNLPPASSGMDRLAHVFGRDVYERMLEIPDLATGMHGRIRGYVSKPGVDRGDRRQQLLFVNGRLLRSTQLAGAWTAAYAGYALVGRHPFGVLMLELPPDHLDPNVHPTKSDVRFRYATQVTDSVKRAIITTLSRDARERLGDAVSPSPSSLPEPFRRSYSLSGSLLATSNVPPGTPVDTSIEEDQVGEETVAESIAPVIERIEVITGECHAAQSSPAEISASISWQSARRLSATLSPQAQTFIEAPSERYRVLAQLDRAFILATDGRGLVIVDQHAAHERVAYEAICAAALGADDRHETVMQPLLVPELIELDFADAQALDESIDALRAAGVEIEPFGERVYRLTAMPAMLAKRRFDVRKYVGDLDEETPDLDARERIWATMACHSVVRAGETMEMEEMQTVVDRLALCLNPMHCPHGRPTIVRFDAPHIARLFRR